MFSCTSFVFTLSRHGFAWRGPLNVHAKGVSCAVVIKCHWAKLLRHFRNTWGQIRNTWGVVFPRKNKHPGKAAHEVCHHRKDAVFIKYHWAQLLRHFRNTFRNIFGAKVLRIQARSTFNFTPKKLSEHFRNTLLLWCFQGSTKNVPKIWFTWRTINIFLHVNCFSERPRGPWAPIFADPWQDKLAPQASYAHAVALLFTAWS